MSVFRWLFKSKKSMAKENTKPVRVGKYTISTHAQNRVAQKNRKVSKLDMLRNLFGKPNVITDVKYDKTGRPSYNRIDKKTSSSINPVTNYVATFRRISDKEEKNYKLVKKGNKYYVYEEKSKRKNKVKRKHNKSNKK
ncbi:MAG: hypothetical protein R3Y13_06035 [bacterium]